MARIAAQMCSSTLPATESVSAIAMGLRPGLPELQLRRERLRELLDPSLAGLRLVLDEHVTQRRAEELEDPKARLAFPLEDAAMPASHCRDEGLRIPLGGRPDAPGHALPLPARRLRPFRAEVDQRQPDQAGLQPRRQLGLVTGRLRMRLVDPHLLAHIA